MSWVQVPSPALNEARRDDLRASCFSWGRFAIGLLGRAAGREVAGGGCGRRDGQSVPLPPAVPAGPRPPPPPPPPPPPAPPPRAPPPPPPPPPRSPLLQPHRSLAGSGVASAFSSPST